MYASEQFKEPSSDLNPLKAPQAPAFEKALAELGVGRAARHFSDFVAEGLEMLKRAESGEAGPAFAHAPSQFSVGAPRIEQACTVLVMDAGGTHTKAGICRREPAAGQDWKILFDLPNEDLDRRGSGLPPLERFAAQTAALAAEILPKLDIRPADVTGVGIIWSNDQENVRFSGDHGGTRGVTGRVTGKDNGQAYRKGEFYVKDLFDGFDLKEPFLTALGAAGFAPRVFVISNDTVCVLKASSGAAAGMVASTGANATSVDAHGMIFNAEMGGRWVIDPRRLSDGDRILCLDRTGALDRRIKLEDLVAGRWLPRIMEGHIMELVQRGVSGFAALADLLFRHGGPDRQFLCGRDLSRLLTDGCLAHDPARGSERERRLHCAVSAVILPELCALARALTDRAGMMAAGMAYAALFNELQRKDDAKLSLDSSQAAFLPGYLDVMRERLAELAGPGKRVTVDLQRPSGPGNAVSVPMRGLAEMLAEEL